MKKISFQIIIFLCFIFYSCESTYKDKKPRFKKSKEVELNGLKGRMISFTDSSGKVLPLPSSCDYYIEFKQLRNAYGIIKMYSVKKDTLSEDYKRFIQTSRYNKYIDYLYVMDNTRFYNVNTSISQTFKSNYISSEHRNPYSLPDDIMHAIHVVLDGTGTFKVNQDYLTISITSSPYEIKKIQLLIKLQDQIPPPR